MYEEVEALLAESQVAAETGDMRRAVERLEKAVAVRGSDARLWLLLGTRYADAEMFSGAKHAFERAIELEPLLSEAHSALGTLLVDLEQHPDAERALAKSIELRPTPARYVLLGDTQRMLGKEAAAIESFRRALALDDSDTEALVNLAMILGSGQRNEAIGLLQRALLLDPDSALAHGQLGFLLLGEGLGEEGEAALRRAAELDPDDWRSHMYLGNRLWKVNRLDEAETEFLQACVLGGLAADPHWAAGMFYEAREDYTKAEECYRHGDAVAPRDPTAAYHLGRFLLVRGREEEGLRWLRTALANDPQHKQVLDLLRRHANEDA